MAFCIPKDISRKLLEVAKRGEIDIVKLYNMDSQGRRSFFEIYAGKENAKGINAGFEKAMASAQKDALLKWTEGIFSPGQNKKTQNDIVDRVNSLKEGNLIGANAEGFYQDLIATKLGVNVTEEEMTQIVEKSDKIEKLEKEVNDYGWHSVEYWKAKRDMQNYLYSLTPASKLKIATSTIGRGAMLASFKSPLTNIIGNSVQGLTQSFEKRLASGQYKGSNPSFAREYIACIIKPL